MIVDVYKEIDGERSVIVAANAKTTHIHGLVIHVKPFKQGLQLDPDSITGANPQQVIAEIKSKGYSVQSEYVSIG